MAFRTVTAHSAGAIADSSASSYLYYEPGEDEGHAHRDDVNRFRAVAAADGVGFSATSYQDVMARLAPHRREHVAWFDYMTTRYFAGGSQP